MLGLQARKATLPCGLDINAGHKLERINESATMVEDMNHRHMNDRHMNDRHTAARAHQGAGDGSLRCALKFAGRQRGRRLL